MPKHKGVLSPFEKVLSDLLAWFRATKTEGIIIGGLATSLLSQPRFTKDIDALVWVNQDQWAKFLKIGAKFWFSPRQSAPLVFARRNRVFLLRHSKTNIDVDISLGALPFEKESLERAIHIRFGQFSIPLPTPEDLVIMKAVAHRPKDLIDIAAIIQSHPKLNKRRIRKWVKEFSRILEIPEINQDLQKLLKNSRR